MTYSLVINALGMSPSKACFQTLATVVDIGMGQSDQTDRHTITFPLRILLLIIFVMKL